MEIILLIVWVFVFSVQLGRQEGKWGCFTALIVFFILGAIGAAIGD